MSDSLPHRFVLASASPARRKSLQAAGIEPEVLVSGVDESVVVTDRAEDLCLELARLKALAVLARLSPAASASEDTGTGKAASTGTGSAASTGTGKAASTGTGQRTLIIGCDSVLAFDGEILGKPADPADATRRWLRMRGRSGVLHSGHCLIDVADGRRAEAVASTTVHFADISDDEIAAYVATGEPLAVAGAFTIDGLGGPFVERIEGDPGTVVGLSMPLLRRLLAELGLQITDLWTTVAPGGQSVEPIGNVRS
ncbi:Maf family protein [Micromonospora lupini]|uniref:Nucleoside triphosphate pyrophosphatase n=1 Tax=Micromonospora lupini str. Lupac 08 TaxID=1150864 RepID=I0KWR6_9ACTN|nr:nucleoside triphosphate pyrophosphatase [Micromonospora lupini]CCH16013.1 Putative Maf-like protein Strop_0851 [Micromonospora lupini str. Lupac 08]